MNREDLIQYVSSHLYNENETDVISVDADNIVFLLDNLEITVPQDNRFFVEINAAGLQNSVYFQRIATFSKIVETQEVRNGIDTRAYTGVYDFSHTSPYWEDILCLGVYGLRNRLLDYLQKTDITENSRRFYSNGLKVYDAALRFLNRASEAASLQGKAEIANGLKHLSVSVPHTLYQRMQTIFIFYT